MKPYGSKLKSPAYGQWRESSKGKAESDGTKSPRARSNAEAQEEIEAQTPDEFDPLDWRFIHEEMCEPGCVMQAGHADWCCFCENVMGPPESWGDLCERCKGYPPARNTIDASLTPVTAHLSTLTAPNLRTDHEGHDDMCPCDVAVGTWPEDPFCYECGREMFAPAVMCWGCMAKGLVEFGMPPGYVLRLTVKCDGGCAPRVCHCPGNPYDALLQDTDDL